jgi:hypothetical protein
MDDRRDPQTDAPDEGELLAAYLAAETDDLTTARIERRLLEDPQAAARLDALARTRQRLQRLEQVRPPPGFRARLDARLRAERATPHEHAARAGTRVSSLRRERSRRFAPLATAAALVLAAVLGGVTLLNSIGGSIEESAESADQVTDTAADQPAARDEPLAAEPFAAPESGEQGTAGGESSGADGADESSGAGGAGADRDDAGTLDARAGTLPQVAVDADIAARLRDDAHTTDEPALREADLRARAGLPPQPLCLAGSDAAAVDLVERDGRVLLVALAPGGEGSRVVLFDPGDCTRLRAFVP